MDPSIQELIERTQSDSEFRARIDAHEQERRIQKRPAMRRSTAIYERMNRNKVSVRKSVAWAIKAGNLHRPDRCQLHESTFCSGPVQAHHWAGYEYRFRFHICWLCRRHHKLIEAGNLELPDELRIVQVLNPRRIGRPPLLRTSPKLP